jgi:uncharacterized protein (TIGR02118 family)
MDEQVEGPVKVVVLYGQPTDVGAFEKHYLETHVPLVLQVPYVQRIDAGRAVSAADGGPAAFYRIGELHFASLADMEAALASPEGQAGLADLMTFTTGGVTATIVADLLSVAGKGSDATALT